MKPDMSPAAISRRLRQVGELVEACRALRIQPASVRSSVVLPQPDGPSRKKGSWDSTASDAARKAVVLPNRLTRW